MNARTPDRNTPSPQSDWPSLVAPMLVHTLEYFRRLSRSALTLGIISLGIWALWNTVLVRSAPIEPLSLLGAFGLVLMVRLLWPETRVELYIPRSHNKPASETN